MLLDARPDRIDFRDREFRSQLVSLPAQYPSDQQIGLFLEQYQKSGMVLDQGVDGACTGYGLAAVVNYLSWYRKALEFWQAEQIRDPVDLPPSPEKVSEWMLYSAARLYDEWEGEDYSGSSCRGAMKGWHKHGVCKQLYWPRSGPADEVWAQDAARRPLGAYYRVNVQSIADLQAAIYEVGAVYCSARVHEGWFFDELDTAPALTRFQLTGGNVPDHLAVPIIPLKPQSRGGHAFAVVGYTSRGFIVQNSWGPGWGKTWGRGASSLPDAAGGFALITYEDWVLNGHDAWVAALAAPMLVEEKVTVLKTPSELSLLEQVAQGRAESHLRASAQPGAARRWPIAKAQQHCISMGNDGKLTNGRIDASSAREGLRKSIKDLLNSYPGRDLMIFAHGGLNTKEDALRRAQVLGPWFEDNKILPIFVLWRTGFGETLANIGADFLNSIFPSLEQQRSGVEELVHRLSKQVEKRVDRGFEALAEKVMGKAVWSQMKQNAQAANQHSATRNLTGGMRELADFLKSYQASADRPLRLHLLGHSAGAILLGHFARDLARFSDIASLGLLAPACTLKFANAHFAPLVAAGRLASDKLYIVNLSRKNERADRVGPYNKSLLYLVSRAFEMPRKTPLLGLDDSWILDCEAPGGRRPSPQVSGAFGDENDPLHQAMVLAKLAPYYALTGQKALPDFGAMASLQILQKANTLSDLDPLRQATEALTLDLLTKQDGIHDVLQWRSFTAKHNIPYLLHGAANARVRRTEGASAYQPISHGSIDNDVEVMDWAISKMIGTPIRPATDLTES
ncbi:C1 family peptidase [Pseudophaeobacter arcticus]|uniref:C1 family peptidase n=1 Tax=Pseudophaeobacter arcticus TaxID=385492 RepID=UPI0004021D3C|nr:C1 family peptidase [Pseudophaeobacter arcticus]